MALKAGITWDEIFPVLKVAGLAYSAGLNGNSASDPYNTLNQLPLAWLSGTLKMSNKKAISLAMRCGESAESNFATEPNFWNAVMCSDAAMTAWVMGGKLVHAKESETAFDTLRRSYEEVVERIPQTGRKWNSVAKQWRVLARFLNHRKVKDDLEKAAVLLRLNKHFA